MGKTVLLVVVLAVAGCRQVGVLREQDTAHQDADLGADVQSGKDGGQEAPGSAPEAARDAILAEVGTETTGAEAGAPEATAEAPAAMFLCGTGAGAVNCLTDTEYCQDDYYIQPPVHEAFTCKPYPVSCHACGCVSVSMTYLDSCTCGAFTADATALTVKCCVGGC